MGTTQYLDQSDGSLMLWICQNTEPYIKRVNFTVCKFFKWVIKKIQYGLLVSDPTCKELRSHHSYPHNKIKTEQTKKSVTS